MSKHNKPQYRAPRVSDATGDGYEVLEGFGFPSNEQIRKRLEAGDNIPMAERGPETTYEPGDIAYDIPEISLPWLLAQGIVRRADGAPRPPVTVPVEPPQLHTLSDDIATDDEEADNG